MKKIDVVSRVTEIAEPLASSLGLELVEVEYKQEAKRMILRIYIDKDGGVSLDDCASVSRELNDILDVEDFINGRYTLEVSSPGLNRQLKKDADFNRFLGRLVKIRTIELLADDKGNMRKTFLGNLVGFCDGIATINLKEGQSASIPIGKIDKANLEFEI
jgi:ribosome maturation factor RimP